MSDFRRTFDQALRLLNFLVRLLLAVLLICPLLVLANTNSATNDAERLIASLRNRDSERLFDMHGNAVSELRALMQLRFHATLEVISAIDRSEHNGCKQPCVGALYNVLGYVKDPASIAWLSRKVAKEDVPRFYDNWLPQWENTFDGYGTWPWLEGRTRWIGFFVDTFKNESNSARRARLLGVMSGFDDAIVVSFFQDQAGLSLGSRETLAVERYLSRHGGNTDATKVKAAVDALSTNPDNRQFLIEMAFSFKHEAFVPYLISIADDVPKPYSHESLWNAQSALEHITFELTVSGKDAWENWRAKHGAIGRAGWRDLAIESMRRALLQDERIALASFDKAVYRWNDILFLPFVETELATRVAFRSNVAGWINLTYEPVYRQRLLPLARLVAERPQSLEPWARDLLIDRDFLPGRKKRTWDEEVQLSNGRV